MSNSSLVSYTKISPNKTSPRNKPIDTITIHCYVGQASVEDMGAWFAMPSAEASSNYGIGSDGRIGLFVEEKDRSWCSSSRSNDNRAITIECASNKKDPYAINDKVYSSLIKLCADICKRNGIPKLLWKADKSLIGQVDKQNLTVHRWFANKACPGDYIYNRLGQIANDVNALLGEVTDKYAVRKTFDDVESQTNRFSNLDYAKAEADRYPGYSVFDTTTKKVIYTSKASVSSGRPLSKEDYIAKVAEIATKLYAETKILPSVVIAQCCLETGYGLGSDSNELIAKNNLLGMKADLINNTWKDYTVWDGKTFAKKTPEFQNEIVYKLDYFREYKDYENCIRDYEMFLLHVKNDKGLKYADVAGMTDPKEVITIISKRGYATDPNYITKIINLIEKENLTRFDKVIGDEGLKKEKSKTVPFTVKVEISNLNIRTGPGVDYTRVQFIRKGVYTIIEVKSGNGSKSGWGRLKSGIGWISLDYVTKNI